MRVTKGHNEQDMENENPKKPIVQDEDNSYLLGHRLTTVVNKVYDCPEAYDPSKLSSKCIKVLLLPRVLDVLCFYLAAAAFFWNRENDNYKYFAVRILRPESTTSFTSAFVSVGAILATLAFTVITALVFMLRVAYIKSKRVKNKQEIIIPKVEFPHVDFSKGALFFSTVFFTALMTALHFVVSLIFKKNWKAMPVSVDLAMTAGVLLLINIRSCLKVGNSAVRCYNCHVIANMMSMEMKVTDTFYADASLFVPTQKYNEEERKYIGGKLTSKKVTEHTIGDVHTYKDIKHNRNRISCVCPYCLQSYAEKRVVINDTFEGKEYYTSDSLHHTKDVTYRKP